MEALILFTSAIKAVQLFDWLYCTTNPQNKEMGIPAR